MAFNAHAQSLTFTTFAGPSGGAGSADGTGSAARFAFCSGVATDHAGNVYVSDHFNNTVRKITPAGAVTTLAGSAGLLGNADGTGSAARFDSPRGVATDRGGNVYVADQSNNTIRKVTPAGVVTTLAGSTRFAGPKGVATDSSGNVYVADTSNQIIRKITAAGVVTTLAGSAGLLGSEDGTGSAARFAFPSGVATDAGGNVYVADTAKCTIRKITSAGVVTTLAGSAGLRGSADGTGSAARFNDPAGVATDSGGNVYVADEANNTIRKITAAGVVTTLAGSAGLVGIADGTGSAARFDSPWGVATDGGGNIYVGDRANNTIRKITSAGVVTTLAGSTVPFGSADGPGSAARFRSPKGVAIDNGGNVYVADESNHTIRKITTAGVVTTLAGSAGLHGSADGTGSAARFALPSGVATDGSGNVYVADRSNQIIRKITTAGVVTTLAGSPRLLGSADGTGSAARFVGPSGVAVDGSGNVYVADFGNNTIRKITSAGVVTTLAGSAGSNGSADGTGSAARFAGPTGVTTDRSGNVYVADVRNQTIRKITSSGVVTTLAGSAGHLGSADGTGSAARFWDPTGVATDSSGNVYVADKDSRAIRKITPAGVVTTLAWSADAARFTNPWGVAVDGKGNVYVADSDHNTIRVGRPALSDTAVIDAATGTVGATRQLGTSTQTATTWQWTLIRQPAASAARLSSASIRNPRFTPDVADLCIFQLTASDGVKTSITTVSLTARYP
jgi:sugar lactone lactonase YvrE